MTPLADHSPVTCPHRSHSRVLHQSDPPGPRPQPLTAAISSHRVVQAGDSRSRRFVQCFSSPSENRSVPQSQRWFIRSGGGHPSRGPPPRHRGIGTPAAGPGTPGSSASQHHVGLLVGVPRPMEISQHLQGSLPQHPGIGAEVGQGHSNRPLMLRERGMKGLVAQRSGEGAYLVDCWVKGVASWLMLCEDVGAAGVTGWCYKSGWIDGKSFCKQTFIIRLVASPPLRQPSSKNAPFGAFFISVPHPGPQLQNALGKNGGDESTSD